MTAVTDPEEVPPAKWLMSEDPFWLKGTFLDFKIIHLGRLPFLPCIWDVL